MIQTFFNSDGTGLTAIITVIVDGDHVDPDSWPITNDPAIVLSSHPAATKTVTAIDTGVFKVVWSSLSPALAHGDVVFIAVDGEISATAWTTWQIPVQVVHLPAKPSDVPTAAANRAEMDSNSTQLAAIDTATGTTIPSLLPTLVSGRVPAVVQLIDAGAITATSIAANAFTAAKFASGAFDAVWSVTTRSLTTFGTLVADVWGYTTRVLTAATNLNIPTAEQNAIAVEAAILDEGDATALLAAIAAKVEAFLVNDGDATATLTAIATACNAAVVAGTVGTQVAAIETKAQADARQSALTTAIGTRLADADYTPPNNAAAQAAQTAAESADGKLTAERMALIDGSAQTGTDGDTLETLSNQLDGVGGGGGGLTPENIQDIADATVVGVQAVSDNIQQSQAGVLTAYNYSTWTQSFTDLINITDYDDVIFILKRRKEDPDSKALLKVSSVSGLLILNGAAAATSGDATLVVDQSSPTGEATLTVASAAMSEVPDGKFRDGLKMLKVDEDTVLRSGTTIIRDSPVNETS